MGEDDLVKLCRSIYLQFEKGENVVLSNTQVEQLNLYLKSNSGSYNLSFPVSDTLVIYSDKHIIEYVHGPHPIVRVKSQLVSLKDKFNQVDLNGKAILLHEHGEFISTRDYYSMKVNLHSMPGFLVELFYNSYLNKIERIEVVTDDKRLTNHLDQVNITDLFK